MSRSKAEEEAKPKSDRVTASRASSCPREDEKKKATFVPERSHLKL